MIQVSGSISCEEQVCILLILQKASFLLLLINVLWAFILPKILTRYLKNLVWYLCWLFNSCVCFCLTGFNNSERMCDKEFIIRRAATNRVLNVLRHWVSKHSQVSSLILSICSTFVERYKLTSVHSRNSCDLVLSTKYCESVHFSYLYWMCQNACACVQIFICLFWGISSKMHLSFMMVPLQSHIGLWVSYTLTKLSS